MYIIKNAWKSIIRSKGRNMLIGIIVLVIIISGCIALSIKNSADEIIENTKRSFSITATLTVDRQALLQSLQGNPSSSSTQQNRWGSMLNIPSPDIDAIKLYGESEFLKGYSYNLTASLNSSDITPASFQSDQPNNRFIESARNTLSGQGDYRFIGYNSVDSIPQFINGTYKIVKGSIFEDTEATPVCIISDELAAQNDLDIGSTVLFSNPYDDNQTFEFTVVGIYQDVSVNENSPMSFFSGAANQIITQYEALNTVLLSTSDNEDTRISGQLSSVFYLNGVDSEEPFKKELYDKGLNELYTISTNIESFEETIRPLTNLNNFAQTFLLLVLLIGGIILMVLNIINIRERKYEVGVLRAIGMRKGKVLMQFVTEFFIVTFVFMIMGTLVGSVLSVPTANVMLHNEIQALQQSEQQINMNFGRQGNIPAGGERTQGAMGRFMEQGSMSGFFNRNQNTNYINQINAVINPAVVLQLALMGLLLTVFIGGISVILIVRYEPLAILSNLT